MEDSRVGWENKIMECGSCSRPIQIAFTVNCFIGLNYLLFSLFPFCVIINLMDIRVTIFML